MRFRLGRSAIGGCASSVAPAGRRQLIRTRGRWLETPRSMCCLCRWQRHVAVPILGPVLLGFGAHFGHGRAQLIHLLLQFVNCGGCRSFCGQQAPLGLTPGTSRKQPVNSRSSPVIAGSSSSNQANHSLASQIALPKKTMEVLERCLVNLRDGPDQKLILRAHFLREKSYSDCTLFARASGGGSGFPSPLSGRGLGDEIVGRVMRKTVPSSDVFSTITSPP